MTRRLWGSVLVWGLVLGLLVPGAWGASKTPASREELSLYNPILTAATGCTNAALAAAITAIGSTTTTLLLSPIDGAGAACSWTISSNQTIPRTTTLRVPRGAAVSVNTGITLTLAGPVVADDPDWYSGAGTVTFQATTSGPERDTFAQVGFVRSGCTHATAGTTTSAAFACEAVTQTGRHATQAAAAVTYTGGDGTYWLAVHKDTASTVTSWTRQGSTKYLFRKVTAQPAEPSGGLIIGKVTVSGAAITAFAPYGARSPVSGRLKALIVPEWATSGDGTSGNPWTGWETTIDWTRGRQDVFFPAGYYNQVAPILVTGERTHIHGGGKSATVINFLPTGAPGSTLGGTKTQGAFTFGSGVNSVHYQSSLGKMTLLSTDTTYRKNGVVLIDTSEFYLYDFQVGTDTHWTGDDSHGLWVFGRELGVIERCTLAADWPITISDNPNHSIDIDQFTFRDIYTLTTLASGGSGAHPNIYIDTGVNVTNVNFLQHEWVKGTDGIYWVDTTTAQAALNVVVRDVRWEQSTDNAGYMIRIEHNYNLQNLTLANIYGGLLSNGVRLRTIYGALIEHISFVRAGGECFNLDTSSRNITTIGNFCQSGSSIGFGTLSPLITTGSAASTDLPFRLYDSANRLTSVLTPGGTSYSPSGIIVRNSTSQATTGTAEETLATLVVPAGTLSANGQALRIVAVYTTANNANSKVARLRWDGTGGSNIASISVTSATSPVVLTGYVLRTTSSSAQLVFGHSEGTANVNSAVENPDTVNVANAVTIYVRGETPTASGDLTFQAAWIEYLP